MPIKHEFVFKTIVRSSNNVTVPEKIITELDALKKEAFSHTGSNDSSFTILIQKEAGVISDGGIDSEGKLSASQEAAAKSIHTLSLEAVKGNGEDGGKIKTVFVFKM